MEDLTKNRVIIFTYNEFEKFINEVTYGTISITWNGSDGWFWLIRNLNTDGEVNDWLEEYGKEAKKEIDSVGSYGNDEFVYRMIGKKFNAIVKTLVVDVNSDKVVIIFE